MSAQSQYTRTGGDDNHDYPPAHLWDEHGDLVDGRFIRFDKGRTRDYGAKPVLVLDVDGDERSVWLLQTVLFEEVRRELAERPNHDLIPGERVVIRRLEPKIGDTGRTYRPFRVLFPDRPRTSTSELFDLGSIPKPATPAEDEDETDEDDEPPF